MRASASTSSQAAGVVTGPDRGTLFDGDVNGCRYVRAVAWGASCLQTSSRENQDGWSVNVLTGQAWPGKRKGMILRNDKLISSLSWSHEHPTCTIVTHHGPLGHVPLGHVPLGHRRMDDDRMDYERMGCEGMGYDENVQPRPSIAAVNAVEETNPKTDYNAPSVAPSANVLNDGPTGCRDPAGTPPPPPMRVCPHAAHLLHTPPSLSGGDSGGGINECKKVARVSGPASGNVLRNLLRASGSIATQCLDGEDLVGKPVGKMHPAARAVPAAQRPSRGQLCADAITFTVLDGHGVGGRHASAAVERAFHEAHVRLVHEVGCGKENGHPENGRTENGRPENGRPENGRTENGRTENGGPENGGPENGGPENGLPDKSMLVPRSEGTVPFLRLEKPIAQSASRSGSPPLLMTRMMELLSGAVAEAQAEVERLNDELHKDFGTTLVSVTLVNDVLISSSCGDSSALLVALPKLAGAAPMIVELCRRHHLTEEGEISRIKKEGKGRIIIGDGGILRLIPAEMTYTCAKKSGLSINMARSIGHVLFKERGLSVRPDFTFLTLGTLPKLLKESRDKVTHSNSNRSIYRLPPLDINACKALANAYGFKARTNSKHDQTKHGGGKQKPKQLHGGKQDGAKHNDALHNAPRNDCDAERNDYEVPRNDCDDQHGGAERNLATSALATCALATSALATSALATSALATGAPAREQETTRGREGRGRGTELDVGRPVTSDGTREQRRPARQRRVQGSVSRRLVDHLVETRRSFAHCRPRRLPPPPGAQGSDPGSELTAAKSAVIPADLFLLLLSDGVTDVFSSTCLIEMLKCAADMERFAAAVTAAARDRRVKGGQRPDNCTCIAVRLIPPTFF